MGPGAVIGWDMSAALSLGAALHIDPALVAEILPEVERAVMAKMNEVRV